MAQLGIAVYHPLHEVLVLAQHQKPHMASHLQLFRRKLVFHVIVASVVEVPHRQLVFSAQVLVDIGGIAPGVYVAGYLVDQEIVHKVVHVDIVPVAVAVGIVVVGIERLFKPGEVQLNGLANLLRQAGALGIFDQDVGAQGHHPFQIGVDVPLPVQVLRRSTVAPQQVAAGGCALGGGAQVEAAVLSVGNGFHHQVEAPVFPV